MTDTLLTTPEGNNELPEGNPTDAESTDSNADENAGAGTEADGNTANEWKAEDISAHEKLSIDGTDYSAQVIELVKENNFSAEQAQLAVDIAGTVAEAITDNLSEKYEAGMQSWIDATRQDSEIGGDKLEENLKAGRHALTTFGNESFAEIIDSSGIGNNVEFIRFMAKVGKALQTKNDSFVLGKTTTTAENKNPYQTMYPSMFDSGGNPVQ